MQCAVLTSFVEVHRFLSLRIEIQKVFLFVEKKISKLQSKLQLFMYVEVSTYINSHNDFLIKFYILYNDIVQLLNFIGWKRKVPSNPSLKLMKSRKTFLFCQFTHYSHWSLSSDITFCIKNIKNKETFFFIKLFLLLTILHNFLISGIPWKAAV